MTMIPTETVKLSASQQELKTYLMDAMPGTRFQHDWFLAREVPNELAEVLLRYGVVQSGAAARLVRMQMSNCHENSLRLAKRYGWDVWTGLALSDDGCWRVHSWCKNTRGRIAETTILRAHYFGIAVRAASRT